MNHCAESLFHVLCFRQGARLKLPAGLRKELFEPGGLMFSAGILSLQRQSPQCWGLCLILPCRAYSIFSSQEFRLIPVSLRLDFNAQKKNSADAGFQNSAPLRALNTADMLCSIFENAYLLEREGNSCLFPIPIHPIYCEEFCSFIFSGFVNPLSDFV